MIPRWLSFPFDLADKLAYAANRRIDRAILWPACKREARKQLASLDVAKAAFATHAFRDPAWLCLGETEIKRQIDNLS